MIRRPAVWLTLAVTVLGARAASADEFVAPDGNSLRQTKLERACSTSLARFCPALAETPGQTRNQVICLKHYRSSLPTYCRAAVNAAMK